MQFEFSNTSKYEVLGYGLGGDYLLERIYLNLY
jgi:hypothetical protein